METKTLFFAILASVATVRSHEVATSHQSVVSGEGWRYGYGIAHGPHGIGHAVGESFPHGYGGFGTYAPSFGYAHKPVLPPLPVKPLIIQVPQYIIPYHYNNFHYQPYGNIYPYGYGHLGYHSGYNGYHGHEHAGYHGHHELAGYHGHPHHGAYYDLFGPSNEHH